MLSAVARRSEPKSSPSTGRSFWQRHGGAPAPGDPGLAAGRETRLPDRVDYVIIGGGLAGLSTALALADAEPTASIALLEAQFLGFGASGRNAGLLGPLPAPLWLASASSNPEHLWGLVHANRRVHEIGQWLECDVPGSGAKRHTLRIEGQGYFTSMGLSRVARLLSTAGIENGAGRTPDGRMAVDLETRVVDPYRTVRALADRARQRSVQVFEGVRVRGVEELDGLAKVTSADGQLITARAAIVCTNAYTASLQLPEPAKAKVVHNFMVATAPAQSDQLAKPGAEQRFVVELNTAYVFYRLQEGRVVYGGIERFKPSGGSDFDVPVDVLAGLERLLGRSFPGTGLVPAEAWGGIYHQTATDLPIIRRTGQRGTIVLNVGYGGTGVAMTLMCGRLAAALARGGSFANPEDQRLYRALCETRVPVGGLARFVGGVAWDIVRLHRP